MSKKREPLLSDEDLLRDVPFKNGANEWMSGAWYVRREYESARAKDAELIQKLVDDMRRLRIEFGNRVGQTTQIGITSLAAADAQGFKPSEP